MIKQDKEIQKYVEKLVGELEQSLSKQLIVFGLTENMEPMHAGAIFLSASISAVYKTIGVAMAAHSEKVDQQELEQNLRDVFNASINDAHNSFDIEKVINTAKKYNAEFRPKRKRNERTK